MSHLTHLGPPTEIYGIVSSKALEASNDVVRPAGGENITVSPTADDGGAKKSNCC